MNKYQPLIVLFVMAGMLASPLARPVDAIALPVFDWLKYLQDQIFHNQKIIHLKMIIGRVMKIWELEQEMRSFFRRIYTAMKESELITGRDLLWMMMNSPFLKDLQKQDPWWFVWNSNLRLSVIFPELVDFSYMTDNYLYTHRREHRDYVDKTIAHLKEKVADLENLRDHLRITRRAYMENIRQLDQFSNLLISYTRSNQVGKLIGLLANLELMNARLGLELNFNRRIQETMSLKNEIWASVNYNREAHFRQLGGK